MVRGDTWRGRREAVKKWMNGRMDEGKERGRRRGGGSEGERRRGRERGGGSEGKGARGMEIGGGRRNQES